MISYIRYIDECDITIQSQHNIEVKKSLEKKGIYELFINNIPVFDGGYDHPCGYKKSVIFKDLSETLIQLNTTTKEGKEWIYLIDITNGFKGKFYARLEDKYEKVPRDMAIEKIMSFDKYNEKYTKTFIAYNGYEMFVHLISNEDKTQKFLYYPIREKATIVNCDEHETEKKVSLTFKCYEKKCSIEWNKITGKYCINEMPAEILNKYFLERTIASDPEIINHADISYTKEVTPVDFFLKFYGHPFFVNDLTESLPRMDVLSNSRRITISRFQTVIQLQKEGLNGSIHNFYINTTRLDKHGCQNFYCGVVENDTTKKLRNNVIKKLTEFKKDNIEHNINFVIYSKNSLFIHTITKDEKASIYWYATLEGKLTKQKLRSTKGEELRFSQCSISYAPEQITPKHRVIVYRLNGDLATQLLDIKDDENQNIETPFSQTFFNFGTKFKQKVFEDRKRFPEDSKVDVEFKHTDYNLNINFL